MPEIKRKLLESDTAVLYVYGFAITTKKVNSKKDSNMETRSFVQLNYGKKSYMFTHYSVFTININNY